MGMNIHVEIRKRDELLKYWIDLEREGKRFGRGWGYGWDESMKVYDEDKILGTDDEQQRFLLLFLFYLLLSIKEGVLKERY
jgi:hypothetical protein